MRVRAGGAGRPARSRGGGPGAEPGDDVPRRACHRRAQHLANRLDAGSRFDLQLQDAVELRRTPCDLDAAANAVRRTSFPNAEQFASVYILQPPDMLHMFTTYGLDALKAAGHGA